MYQNLFRLAGLALQAAAQNTPTDKPVPEAGSLPTSLVHQVKMLEQNLAKAMMINEALWEIIRDQHHLTEQQLYDKLYEVDMRDGLLDGKNQKSVRDCPACHRPVSGRHSACLYCGQAIDEGIFKITST